MLHRGYVFPCSHADEGGYQFFWSSFNTEVQRGDTVTWEWNLDFPGLVVNVFQTTEAGSSVPLEGGFSSESSVSGSFSFTFTRPGIFYYATELTQQLVVYGTVTVLQPASQSAVIRVIVDGFDAEFVPVNEVSGDRELSLPERKRRVVDECVDELPANGDVETNGFSLFYSVCSTPSVTLVTPTVGTVLTNFTLSGSLLTPQLLGESVNVQFGGHSCLVHSMTDTEIICQLDPASMPPSFTPLSLSVTIPGLGDASIDIDQTPIELVPIITSLSPLSSSTEGGSHLFISGYGFPEGEVSVSVGDSMCSVVAQTYSTIQCVTSRGSVATVPVSE